MTAPEVDFVLTAVRDDYPGGTALADIPLERIDRDNSDNLDKAANVPDLSDPVHEHTTTLQETNLFLANSTTWTDTAIDPDYNVQTERVVGIRLEGAHVSEGGAIDPQAGTADAASYPTWNVLQWDTLKSNVREAIYADANRKYPSVANRANIGFKDLFIENQTDLSSNFTDYYLWTADVRFVGFETLP